MDPLGHQVQEGTLESLASQGARGPEAPQAPQATGSAWKRYAP